MEQQDSDAIRLLRSNKLSIFQGLTRLHVIKENKRIL